MTGVQDVVRSSDAFVTSPMLTFFMIFFSSTFLANLRSSFNVRSSFSSVLLCQLNIFIWECGSYETNSLNLRLFNQRLKVLNISLNLQNNTPLSLPDRLAHLNNLYKSKLAIKPVQEVSTYLMINKCLIHHDKFSAAHVFEKFYFKTFPNLVGHIFDLYFFELHSRPSLDKVRIDPVENAAEYCHTMCQLGHAGSFGKKGAENK